jgi:pyrroline-5-carboxylate reductase
VIQRKVGFIGAGVMAEALLSGMLRAKAAEAGKLYASDPSEERRALLIMKLGSNVFADNRRLVRAVDVLVLSVKPKVVPAVAAEIAGDLTPAHLVVSVAAGVTLGALQAMLGAGRLIRVMPNTPALVGEGASAYCAARGATAEDAALVEEMLGSVGLCVRVEETHMDAVTGLSGSGPAYVYLVIEALTDGGVKMGLPRDVAARLAATTVCGAAKMVLETAKSPAELRRHVTTPGGTTMEGLRVLDAAGVARAFQEAVAAAADKSRRMAEAR